MVTMSRRVHNGRGEFVLVTVGRHGGRVHLSVTNHLGREIQDWSDEVAEAVRDLLDPVHITPAVMQPEETK